MPDQTPTRVRGRPPRRHDRPMPTIPQSTKSSLQQRLGEHARKHWPQLASVQVRFRGTFAYVSGQLQDGEVLPLCRLPTGGFAGAPEEALDCACDLYLSGPDI